MDLSNIQNHLYNFLQNQKTKNKIKVYKLSWKIGHNFYDQNIDEGEMSIGTSDECDLQIKAKGVRKRHVRLKRNKNKVYIEPYGKAKISIKNVQIEGLCLIKINQSFNFGNVSAHINQFIPEDSKAAVSLKNISVKSDVDEGELNFFSFASQQLELINHFWERSLKHKEIIRGDQVLELLWDTVLPINAALFQSYKQDKWILLAERKENKDTKSINSTNDQKDDCLSFVFEIEGQKYLLKILFSEDNYPNWQKQICKQLLFLFAHSKQKINYSKKLFKKSYSLKSDPWKDLIGKQIRNHLSKYNELCKLSDTVLILGETGTGKELVAKALANIWKRKGSFIAINCASIPQDLLDSELFGMESGTATGVTERHGRLEQAEGGVLFLDEISEMPFNLQSKLLRVIQEREYFRIGGKQLRQADVKIIAASNCTEDDLQNGKMRSDLYFRLTEACIIIPPLRERLNDLSALCEYFLLEFEEKFHRGILGISETAFNHMKDYRWPGNIRELQNKLRYLYSTASPNGLIKQIHFTDNFTIQKNMLSDNKTLPSIMSDIKQQIITDRIEKYNNVEQAAKSLGLSKGYLYREIKKYKI